MNGNACNSVVGVDPGKTGAICVFRGTQFIVVRDMPTDKSKDGKTIYDEDAIIQFLKVERSIAKANKGELFVMLEHQHAFPRQGGVGNFSMGYGYACWVMALKALHVPRKIVTAAQWRKVIFTEKERLAMIEGAQSHAQARNMRKPASVKKAIKLVPRAKNFLTRKMDDGRAEAILIALAARKINIHANSNL